MDRATALLDSRDEAERRLLADQELEANRFCPADSSRVCRRSARITWAPDDMSFTSEAGDPQVARWAGYRMRNDIQVERENDNLDLVWHGTERTARGTYAAQFEVFEYE